MFLSVDFAKVAPSLLVLPGKGGSDAKIGDSLVFLKDLVEHRETYRRLMATTAIKLHPKGYSLRDIWDGDGVNDNAVLTIIRHDQNAVVIKGAVGDLSTTAFVLDYALFERLVYNLVVNFDVFGGIEHQVLTRIYMDLIRMEAEDLFLMFLPPKERQRLRKLWYKGFLTDLKMKYVFPLIGPDLPTAVRFAATPDTNRQLVEMILFSHFTKKARGPVDPLNWKKLQARGLPPAELRAQGIQRDLKRITSLSEDNSKLSFAQFFPDIAYLVVKNKKTPARVFSIIHNKAHENISWILAESLRMNPKEDLLTVREGFLGAYPNMIFSVTTRDLKHFIDRALRIKSKEDFSALVDSYGIRRQDPKFWIHYDELNSIYNLSYPSEFGYLDLTRYGL